MKHISVDLETMGTRPDSAIVSIGAVEFELPTIESVVNYEEPVFGREFFVNVDLQSCIDAGLTITGGTVMWWLKKEQAARDALSDPSKPMVDIHIVLAMLSQFYQECGADWIWARGQDFDISILRVAYAQCKMRHPWIYNHARDSRTLYAALAFDDTKMPPVGTAHNALDDAKWEARAICEAHRLAFVRAYNHALLVRRVEGREDPADAILETLAGEHGRITDFTKVG